MYMQDSKEIMDKMVDIYNYMAVKQSTKLSLVFKDGIRLVCEIDTSNYKRMVKDNAD